MDALVILAMFVGAIVALLYLARNKAGVGTARDIAAQKDVPRRPTGIYPQQTRPGYDPIDDRTGDAGVRPRL